MSQINKVTRIAKLEKTVTDLGSTEELIESKIKSVKDQAEDNKRTLSTRLNTLEETVHANLSQGTVKPTGQMPTGGSDSNFLLNKIQDLQKQIDAVAVEKYQGTANTSSTGNAGLESQIKDIDSRLKVYEQLLNEIKQKGISANPDKVNNVNTVK